MRFFKNNVQLFSSERERRFIFLLFLFFFSWECWDIGTRSRTILTNGYICMDVA